MNKSPRHLSGFTLIELLVSIAVFSLMTVLAYAGIGSILNQDKLSAEHETDLKRLQRTVMFIEKDLRQVTLRTRNDGFSAPLSPMIANDDFNTGFLEFTRSGNSNPTQLKRSSLMRVRYSLEDEDLKRETWNLVDHSDIEPVSVVLMSGVTGVELSFLPDSGEEVDEWTKVDELPIGIEVIIETERWGQIRRVLPLYY
ncbi:type II secretion system protein GspJ [Leucothrix sargassi]|nr:type II secretion system protein GspJ [Leucothrix sargassi]